MLVRNFLTRAIRMALYVGIVPVFQMGGMKAPVRTMGITGHIQTTPQACHAFVKIVRGVLLARVVRILTVVLPRAKDTQGHGRRLRNRGVF